jgi:MMP 1-O-methyltransferase
MRADLERDLAAVAGFADLVRRLTGIHGWLAEEEGYFLYRLARDGEGAGEVVEIGSWMGRSTAWLAAGCKTAARERVHAVDTFAGSTEHQELEVLKSAGTTYHQFAENLERVGLFDYVEPVIAPSREAERRWDGKPIRLLFIDGDHSYEGVRADFDAWSRHVIAGGVIAFDDVIDKWPGVKRCFDEVIAQDESWENYGGIGKVRAVRRLG